MKSEHSGVNREIIARALAKGNKRVYFIGIGGVSMSSLAVMLAGRGFTVLGSDSAKSSVTERLSSVGMEITYSQSGELLRRCRPALAVYSLSADGENGDLLAARELGVTAVSRAELLGYLAGEYGRSLAVSGSHGKTTVTSLLKDIFTLAGREPTTLLGAVGEGGACEIIGGSELLVFESCEYRNSFLKIKPTHQIILNAELDHTDFFDSEEMLMRSFTECALGARDFVFLPDSFSALEEIKRVRGERAVSFGESQDADYRYEITGNNKGRYSYRLFSGNVLLGEISLGAEGIHNVRNSVAAVVAAYHSGVKFSVCRAAVEAFLPPPRRNERIGRIAGADIIYDYAHHPTEINAILATLGDMGYRKIAVVFCPHTYSRTKSFAEEFAKALSRIFLAVITEIYAAREKPMEGVSSQWLAELINSHGGNAIAKNQVEIFDYIKDILPSLDCIVLMGAGNLDALKERLLKKG